MGSGLLARFSIIIPFSGNAQQLEESLVSVLENQPDDCQIVVVLNGVYNDPYDLKDEICFVHAPVGADLVRCIHLGIDASDSPVVHVLFPGVEVSPGWADAALAHFVDARVVAVAPVILDRDNSDCSLAAGIRYGSSGSVELACRGRSPAQIDPKAVSVLGPDPRAAFYRKSAVNSVGRFAVELGPWFAGVDLALKLEQAGGRCVVEPESQVRATASVMPRVGAFRRALRAERLFWRWAPRTNWLVALVAHLGEAVLDVCREFPGPGMATGLLGRLVGLCLVGADRQHRRRFLDSRRDALTARAVVAAPHFATQGSLAEK